MDWNQIENDVHFQTQQALGSVSEYKNGREDIGRSIHQRPFYGMTGDLEDPTPVFAPPRQSKRVSNPNNNIDIAPLENYIQDLRNVTMLQGKKVLSIENILSSYSGVFESSTEAQSSLIMRIDGIEQNLRGSNKILLDASKERNVLSIHVKNLAGKVMSLEDSIQINDRSYATKEAFSQLLDSTVDEIKSVGVAVSQASVKSSQSLSLIEALIQAIHRMRGRLDAFGEDEMDAGQSLNYEFLSSLTGERQREQVVRLLRESLLNSVTSIAKDVSNREAERICNSVNGMLKTLNGQLMLSVDEVGKQTKATCNAANNKATQCLAATNRLESQQADIIRSIEDHADRTRDHVAQQLRQAMETIGEVLEDVSSIQKTVKGDLKSFDVELTEQRKTLYLELGLLKEGHGTLKASCAISDRAVSGELAALDKRVADLDSEVRSLRAMMKADNEESVVKVTSSDLSKEVITALVTEVILSDTIERRNRDLAEVAEVISSKQLGQVAALGEETESRISAQLEALKKDFDQAMEVMAKKLAQKEAEAESSKAQSSVDAEQWRDKADQRIAEFQQRSTQQSAESVALIQQLRVDLEKKSSELAAAVVALAEKNEKAVTSSATAASDAKAIEREQAESAAAALQVLQKEILKVSGKVGEAQTALAKMNVQSMHLQDAVTSSSTTAKESHVLVADLAVTVEMLEKRHSESAALAAGASRDEVHEQFKRLEDRIDAVASSVSTPRKDGDSTTENRVQTVAEQHLKLTAEVDSLRLSFLKAEKDQLIAMSQTTSTLKKLEVALTGVEDGLDLLHGEVDQQAEQSSLLQKKLLLTEERVCKIESAASRPQTASPSARQYESSPAFSLAGKSSSLLESKAGAAVGARSEATAAPANQKQVTVSNGTITTISAATAEVQRLNSVSYGGSSIANSYSSPKQQSATALPTEASVKEPESVSRVDTKVPSKYSNTLTRAGSDDSASVNGTSFNGSELTASPMKPFESVLTRPDALGEKGRGSLQGAKEEKPLGGAGQLPIASKAVNAIPKASAFSRSKSNDSDCDELSEGDVFSNREEVMKQIAGQSLQQRWSLPLERSKLADVKPLGTAAVSANQSSGALSKRIDKGRTAGATMESDSEGEDERDSSSEEEDDDDDFTENSMSASEDRDAHSGRSGNRNSAIKGATPVLLRRGHSDEAVDLSSSFDTSASSPLRNQYETPSLDTSLPVSSPQMSTSPEYLGDKRSSLKPLNPIGRIMGPSTPVLSAPALTSLKATESPSLATATSSTSATPLSSIQKTALSPVSTAAAAAGPVVRSPQPILSGSLLSLGRKPVTAAVPVPATSLGSVTQLPSNKAYEAPSKTATNTYTNISPNQSKSKAEEEDDDGNLDFDASSWDEEDEADESF